MQIKIKPVEEKFVLLERKIKGELVKALQNEELGEVEALAFLQIFGQADNYWELRLFVEVFRGEFQFLSNLDEVIREGQKSDLEAFLSQILPGLVHTDPDLVVTVSKYAATPGATLSGLFEKFQQLQK